MIDKGFSSIVFDCTTILRWDRPVVGIIRTQLEVLKYLLESDYKTTFVAFKPNKMEMFPLPKEYLAEKIAQLSSIKSYPEKHKDPIKSASRHFKSVLDRLVKMNRLAEDILKKISPQINNLKSYKETLIEELSTLILPPIPKKTRSIFDKETLFISLGLDWDHSNYPLLYRLKQEIGFKFVGIFYDGIVLRNPQWSISDEHTEKLVQHFYYLAYICDSLVSISEYSQSEFLALAHEKSIDIKACIKVISLGNALGLEQQQDTEEESLSATNLLPIKSNPTIFLQNDPKTGELVSFDGSDTVKLPDPVLLPRFKGRSHKSDYVLYVSTLEPRKNHTLLLDVWKILMEQKGDDIPDLVLVGMRGWKMENFFERYEKDEKLKQYVHYYPDVGDEELGFLYQEALFAVFPAFIEGFGLGAVEALSYGKPVIISDAPALIEATQHLMPSLNPYDANLWAEQIMQWYYNRYEIKQYSKRIKKDFLRREWKDFAKDLIEFALTKEEQI